MIGLINWVFSSKISEVLSLYLKATVRVHVQLAPSSGEGGCQF
jgi:hypothetical protein